MTINDKDKTKELLDRTIEKSKEFQREVDPSYFSQCSARGRPCADYGVSTAKKPKPKKVINMEKRMKTEKSRPLQNKK